MSATDINTPIRILIAGGGPAGLVLAHALYESGLTSAQLEIVVLERRPAIVEPSGNSLGLYGHTVRVLDQLGGGMAAAVSRRGSPVTNYILCDRSGAVLHRNNIFGQLQSLVARPLALLDRVTFLGIVWDALAEKMRVQEAEGKPRITVLTGKRIVAVDQDDSRVQVVCADGSSYDGDILVGADGVRSIVRRLAVTGQPPIASSSQTPSTTSTSSTSTSASTSETALDTDATGPFRTRYVFFFGMSPVPSRFLSADRTSCSLPPGTMVEAAAPGRTVQLAMCGGPGDLIFWGVYRRSVAPGQTGRRTYAPESSLNKQAAAEGTGASGVGGGGRYSEDDVRAFAAREADAVVIRAATPGSNGSSGERTLTIGELFATSIPGRCGMTDMEEGVVPPGQRCVDDLLPAEEAAKVRHSDVGQESGWAWSRGRVVCVGDAVHKTTPNLGFGSNMAIEGVVVLMNKLRPLLLEAAAANAGKGYVLTTSRLDATFCAYAAARYPRARRWTGVSGLYTGAAAWETWPGRLCHRWLPSILSPGFVARHLLAPFCCDAPVLDWLDEPGFVEGPMAWKYRAGDGGKGAATGAGQEKGGSGGKDGRLLGSPAAWAWVCRPIERLVHDAWTRFS